MQKVLCMLLFLLSLKTYMGWAYMGRCPWTLEAARGSYFFQQGTHFLQSVTETFTVFVAFMLVVGYSVTKTDLTLIEIKVIFGATTGKFVMQMIQNALSGHATFVPAVVVLGIGTDFTLMCLILGCTFNV